MWRWRKKGSARNLNILRSQRSPDPYVTELDGEKLPSGSRAALALLNEQLQELPQDLSARWLLNIAHLTLGEYPDKMPAPFLIPPKHFASEYEMPRFADVSAGVGLDLDDLAGGVILDDFDNDGLIDLMVSAWDFPGQLCYFHNNGDGTFTQRTSKAGLVGEVAALNIQQTDCNNDGFLDVWLLRGGWLNGAGRVPKSLLRDNGAGTVTESLAKVGIRIAAFVKGVACADCDNDGCPDLYLSIRDQSLVLLLNDGPDATGQWHFIEATERAGIARDVFPSLGALFFDYDNDGWEDLLVFGYSIPEGVGDIAADYMGLPNSGQMMRLYHNNRNGTFSELSEAMHLNRICQAMSHNFGDLDNDGWLDFYGATDDPDLRTVIPNRMFRNAGGKFFQDVTTATGTGSLQKGRAVGVADLNEDGEMKLTGVKANHAAIEACIHVVVTTPPGRRDIHRTVNSGGSFGSNPLRQEIGLGDATAVEVVEIRWPGSDLGQSVRGLELDQTYEIREGDSVITKRMVRPFLLKGTMAVRP